MSNRDLVRCTGMVCLTGLAITLILTHQTTFIPILAGWAFLIFILT